MVQALRKHTPLFSIIAVLVLLPVMLKRSWWPWFLPIVTAESGAVEGALLRAGIDPDALAAAGISDEDVAGIVADAGAQVATLTSLANADAAWVSAKQDVQRPERLIRSGRGSQEDVTAYGQAQSAFEAAEAARTSALDALFAAAVADLDEGEVETLATIRANKGWELPAHYLVVNRTEADWVALDRALANERISAERGHEPDQQCASLLATVEQNPDIAAATTACTTNVAAITTAWNAALE